MRAHFWEKNFYRYCFALGVIIGAAFAFPPYFKSIEEANAISVTTPELPIQVGEVTSAMILDGTIANVDISPTAGISSTKIAETGGYNFITSSSQNISGTKTFGSFPILPSTDPTSTYSAATKNYVDNAGGNPQVTVTAGMDIKAGWAVFMANDVQTFIKHKNVTTTEAGACAFPKTTQGGQNAAGCAQSFTSSSTIDQLQFGLSMNKVGAPSAAVIVELRYNNGGTPSSTVIASTSISQTTITTGELNHYVTFPGNPVIATNTVYWVVATSTIAPSETNYFHWWQTSVNDTDGAASCFANGAWGACASAVDGKYRINIGTQNARIYPTSAAEASSSNAFIGIAQTAIQYLQSGNVRTAGVASTSVNLKTGYQYYLADAIGEVSSTAGTVSRKACIAAATSTCVITNLW